MEVLAIFLYVVVYTTVIYGIGLCVGFEKGTDARDIVTETEIAQLWIKIKRCQIEAAVLRAKYRNLKLKIKALEGDKYADKL